MGVSKKFHLETVCSLIVLLLLLLLLTKKSSIENFSFIPWLLSSSDLPSYGSGSRKRYTLFLIFLIFLFRGGGVFAWEGREWLTWGKEGFSWRTGGRENLYSRLTIKWTSSKTVFKDIHYTLTAPSINCFWKSIYCITQKINISEHACQTFLKELAIFLKYRKLW